MKKFLFASTALVAFAGAAAAGEIKISADGYMGGAMGTYDGDGIFTTTDGVDPTTGATIPTDSSYTFVYDLDFNIAATTSTDGGLEFSAQIDIDDAGSSQGPLPDDSAMGSIGVSGAFGSLTMGDVNAAAEEVVGDLAPVGLTGLDDFNEILFLVTSGGEPYGSPVAAYTYEFSGAKLALGVTDDQGWSLGGGYDGGMWSVGLGYESVQAGAVITLRDPGDAFFPDTISGAFDIIAPSDAHQTIGQASVTFSGLTLKGVYGLIDLGSAGDMDQYGVSASYTIDATTINAYYRALDYQAGNSSGNSDELDQFYGIGASYDLGGGLAVRGGVAQYDYEALKSAIVVADFGLAYEF